MISCGVDMNLSQFNNSTMFQIYYTGGVVNGFLYETLGKLGVGSLSANVMSW